MKNIGSHLFVIIFCVFIGVCSVCAAVPGARNLLMRDGIEHVEAKSGSGIDSWSEFELVHTEVVNEPDVSAYYVIYVFRHVPTDIMYVKVGADSGMTVMYAGNSDLLTYDRWCMLHEKE